MYCYHCCMKKISNNPHDKLFKKFLKDKKVACDLLKNHLPAHVLEKLDLSKLQATSETAIDEEWKEFHNDIVFRCQTKTREDTYIYTLIEHQSTPDRFMPLRLLRYKINIVGKYLDVKQRPDKIPNIVSLLIYNGEGRYPYVKDVFSCFRNSQIAENDITKPMNLLDLSQVPTTEITRMGGADAVLKLLLKFGRERDSIQQIQQLISSRPEIFVSLSQAQAGYMYEYILFVGNGTKENANAMKEAIQQTYEEPKAAKIFTLADLIKQEAMEEGIEKRNLEIAKEMLSDGEEPTKVSRYTGLSRKEIEALASPI